MLASCPTCDHDFPCDATTTALTCPLCEASVPIPPPPPRPQLPVAILPPKWTPPRRRLWTRFAGIGLAFLAIGLALCLGVGYLFWEHVTDPEFLRMDSAEGRFHVEFPGKHYIANPVTWGPTGIVRFPMVGYERTWPDEHYMVAWVEIPPEQLALGEGVVLDESINNATSFDTKVVEVLRKEAITVSGYPAREAVFGTKYSSGKNIMRVVVAHKRLYILVVTGSFIQDDSARAKQFLNSFTLH